jgi:hypothetical protein
MTPTHSPPLVRRRGECAGAMRASRARRPVPAVCCCKQGCERPGAVFQCVQCAAVAVVQLGAGHVWVAGVWLVSRGWVDLSGCGCLVLRALCVHAPLPLGRCCTCAVVFKQPREFTCEEADSFNGGCVTTVCTTLAADVVQSRAWGRGGCSLVFAWLLQWPACRCRLAPVTHGQNDSLVVMPMTPND